LALFGITGDPDFPDGMQLALVGTPAGIKLENAIQSFCDTHDAVEVDKIFMDNGVPCSTIYTIELAENNPHYVAREVFAEWDDPQYGKVKGVNILPKFEKAPGQIWRGAPLYGMDNSDVLKEFGYTQAEVDALYEKGVLRAGKGCH
jgi:L-carnitine CoA-transferase/bile acid-CoA hydrolase